MRGPVQAHDDEAQRVGEDLGYEIADRVAESLKGAEKVDRKELKADPTAVKDDVAAAGATS